LGIELNFNPAANKGNGVIPTRILQLTDLYCVENSSYSLEDFMNFHQSIDFPGNLKQIICEKVNEDVYIINTTLNLFDLLKDYQNSIKNTNPLQ
jgi:hypothetical protein